MASYSFSQVERLWVNAGGSKTEAPIMAAIALAESGGNPNAHNASGASGLWQIMLPVNAGDVPGGAGNVYNPQANAQAAVRVYNSQGLSAWTTYTSGAYKHFLPSSGGGGFLGTLENTLGDLGLPISQAGDVAQGIGSAAGSVGSAAGSVGSAASDVGSGISSVAGSLGSVASAIGWLFTPSNWLRILKFVAGAIAVYLGVKALAGIQTGPSDIAVKAAKVVK